MGREWCQLQCLTVVAYRQWPHHDADERLQQESQLHSVVELRLALGETVPSAQFRQLSFLALPEVLHFGDYHILCALRTIL